MNYNKTIAIMTWYIGLNCGANLQAYALNHYLNSHGIEAKTIQYDVANDLDISRKEIIKLALHGHGLKTIIPRLIFAPYRASKAKEFEKFRSDYIYQTDRVTFENQLYDLNDEFDIFICGSDQIWNPIFLNPIYMLNFVNDEKKKISYAASIGVRTYPREKKKVVKAWLDRFSHISVREIDSVNTICQICDVKDVCNVCDPVVLLNKEEWVKLANQKDVQFNTNKRYLLFYGIHKDSEQIKEIKRYARRKKLLLANIAYPIGNFEIIDLFWGDVKVKDITPISFLNLILNAEMIVTDSFHCVLFSLIFQKNFWTFKRKDYEGMNVRMESLLKKMELLSRMIEPNILNRHIEDEMSIDYEKANCILKQWQQESKVWLHKALTE